MANTYKFPNKTKKEKKMNSYAIDNDDKLDELLDVYEMRRAEVPDWAVESDSELIGLQAEIDEELRKKAKKEKY